jgi:hypothetical protein
MELVQTQLRIKNEACVFSDEKLDYTHDSQSYLINYLDFLTLSIYKGILTSSKVVYHSKVANHEISNRINFYLGWTSTWSVQREHTTPKLTASYLTTRQGVLTQS